MEPREVSIIYPQYLRSAPGIYIYGRWSDYFSDVRLLRPGPEPGCKPPPPTGKYYPIVRSTDPDYWTELVACPRSAR